MEGKRNWAYLEDPTTLSIPSNNHSTTSFRPDIPTQDQEFRKNDLTKKSSDKKVKKLWIILILMTVVLSVACVTLGIFIALFLERSEVTNEKEISDNSYEMPSSEYMGQVLKHPCDRECHANDTGRVCHYKFIIELHTTLGRACWDCPSNTSHCFLPHCVQGDGIERGIITVNRSMPGPPIAVCQNDIVLLDVVNEAGIETTTIHFHGEHFRNHQYFDGTPGLTQCPILPGSLFRYKFSADTVGSMYYHSHVAFQRGDGLFGPYIVRAIKDTDPNSKEYDFDLTEHFISVQEWFHQATREAFALHHWDLGKNKADNILINGRGRIDQDQKEANEDINKTNNMPLETFWVTKGFRYRFRIVSPGFTLCPILISVQNHTLTVIASDTGFDEPLSVESLVIHPGERFDVVINANQDEGHYVMNFAGLFDCAKLKAHGEAILAYNLSRNGPISNEEKMTVSSTITNATYEDSVQERLPILAPLNYAPFTNETSDTRNGYIPITELHHIVDNKSKKVLERNIPDKTFYLAYDLNKRNNLHYHHPEYYPFNFSNPGYKFVSAQINNISLKLPLSPLLSQPQDESVFCDEEYFENQNIDCGDNWCECIHRIKVDEGDIVEIFLIDQGFAYDVSHPFHLHGHSFYVIAMERHGQNNSHIGPGPHDGNWITKQKVIDLNESGKIKRNLINPPMKDTVSVPDAGFTLIRFLANNPGYWLLHCHMSWHNHVGMAVVIQVGETDQTKSNPVPNGFPTCGNFVPK